MPLRPAPRITSKARLLAIAAALLFIALAIALVRMNADRKVCESSCREKGFPEVRFTPASRDRAARCFCITAEEAKISNRVPAGVEIPLPP